MKSIDNPVAVFDADGTLWKEDVGLNFFKFQVKNKYIPGEDLLNKAEKLYEQDPAKSCGYIIQLNQGKKVEDFLSYCREYIEQEQLNIFDLQRELIQTLYDHGVQIYIVTASSQLLMTEVLRFLKIPVHQVIGVKTAVSDGLLTDNIIHPVSFGVGKREALLKETVGRNPFFVSGNSMSDLFLLEISTHVRLTIASAQKGDKQYESERELLQKAKDNGWFYLDLSE